MKQTEYLHILEQFPTKKVLVIGDFCLDEYLHGHTEHTSPEAPIPRVIIHSKKYVPGAAGNVVCGVRALGAETYAVGVIGRDTNGSILLSELHTRGIQTQGIIALRGRNTPTYSRVVSGGKQYPEQQLVRFDVENVAPIPSETRDMIRQYILTLIPKMDAVLVADYDEIGGIGIVDEELLHTITTTARTHHITTIGISRQRITLFTQFTAIIPNEIEAGKALGKNLITEHDIYDAGNALRTTLDLEAVIITRGKDGISFIDNHETFSCPSFATKVVDTTGAGDTVTSLITLSFISQASTLHAIELANYAAAITVSKQGTVSVTPKEIQDFINTKYSIGIKKLKTREELHTIVANLKEQQKKILLLNGYFDPPHVGHIHLMNKAKEHGDILVVALNTDKSVHENKGPGRPFLAQSERAKILEGIESVDYITFYDELTPIKLIQEIKPDILVKGNDYKPEEVVGKTIVESYGGKVLLVDVMKGLSSDAILESIKLANAKP